MKKFLYKTDKGYLVKLKDHTPHFDSANKWYRIFGTDPTFWKQIRMALANKEIDMG